MPSYREQRPGQNFTHMQDDLNLHILIMFQDTFSFDIAHIFVGICIGIALFGNSVVYHTVYFIRTIVLIRIVWDR